MTLSPRSHDGDVTSDAANCLLCTLTGRDLLPSLDLKVDPDWDVHERTAAGKGQGCQIPGQEVQGGDLWIILKPPCHMPMLFVFQPVTVARELASNISLLPSANV